MKIERKIKKPNFEKAVEKQTKIGRTAAAETAAAAKKRAERKEVGRTVAAAPAAPALKATQTREAAARKASRTGSVSSIFEEWKAPAREAAAAATPAERRSPFKRSKDLGLPSSAPQITLNNPENVYNSSDEYNPDSNSWTSDNSEFKEEMETIHRKQQKDREETEAWLANRALRRRMGLPESSELEDSNSSESYSQEYSTNSEGKKRDKKKKGKRGNQSKKGKGKGKGKGKPSHKKKK